MAVRLNMPITWPLNEGELVAEDENGLNPLHSALKMSASLTVTKNLLKKWTATELAAMAAPAHHGSSTLVAPLLKEGAAIGVLDLNRRTPLHHACMDEYSNDHIKWSDFAHLMKSLFNHGADLNARNKQGCSPLHLAAGSGYAIHVALLLGKGADVNAIDDNEQTPLLMACIALYHYGDGLGDSRYELTIDQLLCHGANTNARDQKGYIALHWAVNDKNALQQLLRHGAADVNISDNQGNSVLHWAAHLGRCAGPGRGGAMVEAVDNTSRTPIIAACVGVYGVRDRDRFGDYLTIIDQLIDHGANINARDAMGYSTLHWAVNNEVVLNHLLSHGTDINGCDEEGQTALHWTAQLGYSSCVASLVNHGTNIDAQDQKGYNALHWATNNAVILEQLLSYGANIDGCNAEGRTSLYWTSRKGYASSVALLLKRGAAVDAINNIGETPLLAALCQAPCVKLLLERGANVHAVDGTGRTPLLAACTGLYYYKDQGRLCEVYQLTISQLIKHGADIKARDQNGYTTLHWIFNNAPTIKYLLDLGGGRTALHWVAQFGHVSPVNLLLEKSATVEAVSASGETPLLAAYAGIYNSAEQHRRNDCQTVIDCLLDHGANINTQDNKGYTVLHWIINNESVMGGLLYRGAYVNTRDKAGRTPLYWAVQSGYISCVALLLEKGALVDMPDNAGTTPLSCAAYRMRSASVESHYNYKIILRMLQDYGAKASPSK
ncbi:hypothetical protein AX15_005433 [Amanita polypyramis BW_CC]|nr:hypothetical protein AX15_005433 [Amanita polypyramis BW_CC]